MKCPFCGSDNVVRDEVDTCDCVVYAPARCINCHAYEVDDADELLDGTALERQIGWRRGPEDGDKSDAEV